MELELRAYQSVRLEQSSVTCFKNSGPGLWCPYEEFRRVRGGGGPQGVRNAEERECGGGWLGEGAAECSTNVRTMGWGEKVSSSNPHSLGTLP